MAPAVAEALNTVIALSDEGKLEEAVAALQALRADREQDMSSYERFVTLQMSANLNTRLVKYAEAVADYEAILQIGTLADADRLAMANLAGQLYLELQDWNKGIEHLRAVNDMQGGTDRDTLSRLMFAHGQLQQFAQAIPYMEKSLELAGAAAAEEDYRNMASLYIQAGRPAEAIATYEDFLEAFPDSAGREGAAANIAALSVETGDRAKAMSTLRMLIREYPTSARLPTYRQTLDALSQ